MPLNYPDDVHNYDWHKDSPFYEGPDEAIMKEEKVAAIMSDPMLTEEMYARGLLDSRWNEMSGALRRLCYGVNVDEAVATLRECWQAACEKFADSKEYNEIMGDYDDNEEND